MISTHTLTWSVTSFHSLCLVGLKISTHTLTWSVTDGYRLAVSTDTDFNSHAHVERDKTMDMFAIKNNISTHTLTWSVT